MFPRLKSWIQALKLCFFCYLSGSIIWTFFTWLLLILAVLGDEEDEFARIFTLIFFLASIIYHWLLIGLAWLVVKLFWEEPPAAFSPPKGLLSGFWHWAVALFSTLPVTLTFIFSLKFIRHIRYYSGSELARALEISIRAWNWHSFEEPDLIFYLSPVFVIFAAYFYDWGHRLRKKGAELKQKLRRKWIETQTGKM